MRSLFLLFLFTRVFSEETPASFASTDEAMTWARKNIGETLLTAKATSARSEALVVWKESDHSGKSITVLKLCRKVTDARWGYVALETLEDSKDDGMTYDNLGVIEYDKDQDYLGYFTKKNRILIQGLAIDEASGAVPAK